MTAPSPQRADSAEARERLREALACFIEPVAFQITQAGRGDPKGWAGSAVVGARITAGRMIAGPLAPLLDRITAAEARAKTERSNREQWAVQAHEFAAAADRLAREKDAATADRDRLADEVARLRGACTHYEKAFDELWGGYSAAAEDEITAARALTVTGGTTDGQA